MAEIPLKNSIPIVFLCFALLIAFANGRILVDEDENLKSRIEAQLKSLMNSSMAERARQVELQNEKAIVDKPQEIMSMVERSVDNSTARRKLGYFTACETGNAIDDCWRCDPDWHNNRKRLADCAIGFGRNAIGGRDGRFYVVTDSSDNDPVNPKPGTLRHAVIQDEPLWIVFERDMVITLKQELIMNSFKTIDGRGVNVHIANGASITIQFITNVIIHGLHIHDIKPTGNAMVRSSPSHYGWRTMADGDGISIFGVGLWLIVTYFNKSIRWRNKWSNLVQ